MLSIYLILQLGVEVIITQFINIKILIHLHFEYIFNLIIKKMRETLKSYS